MLIDLTRLTYDGMPVYPGDEAPRLLETVHFSEHHCVNFEIYALPSKWDADSAPARVIAKLPA